MKNIKMIIVVAMFAGILLLPGCSSSFKTDLGSNKEDLFF